MSARHLSESELTAHLDGDLSGRARASVEVHLHQCAACAQTLRSLEAITGQVSFLRPVPPPADLRARIATKLALEPVRPLRCQEACRLLQEVLDGQASPFVAGALQLHLNECAACRAEYASLRATTRAVRGLPEALAPDTVWSRVSAPARQPAAPRAWTRPWRPAFAAALAAGAALLLVGRFGLEPVTPGLSPRPAVLRSARPQPVRQARLSPPSSAATEESGDNTEVNLMRPEGATPTLPAPSFLVPVRMAPASTPALQTAALPAPAAADSVRLTSTPTRRSCPGALTKVAQAGFSDEGPQAGMASDDERAQTMDSEARALSAGEPSRPKGASGAREEATTEVAKNWDAANLA